jgi:hypothetical protein
METPDTPQAMGDSFRAQIESTAKPRTPKKYNYHRKDELLSVPPSDMTPAQQAKALTTASRLKKAQLRNAILAAMEEEDMEEVAAVLLKRAKNGHTASIRELRGLIGNVPEEEDAKGSTAPGGVIVMINAAENTPPPVIQVIDAKPIDERAE